MSDDLDALLQSEGVESGGVDALLEWARSRAEELVADSAGDPELGPLLREGGEVGEDRRGHARGRRSRIDAEEPVEPKRGRETGKKGKRGRKKGKRDRVDDVAAEPDVDETPVHAEGDAAASDDGEGRAAHGHDGPTRAEDTANVENDAAASEGWHGAAEAARSELEAWRSAAEEDARRLAEAQALHGRAPRFDDEVTTPRGEGSAAGALPSSDDEEAIDEIEELDVEELELIEDAPSSPEAPAAPRPDAPTFGPPDGTDDVPAWKAALFAAETGSDAEAAKLVKEGESGMRPLPEPAEPPVHGERLEAEEDEISQHKIDLSDLDGDPNGG